VEIGADTGPLIKGLKRANRALNSYAANMASMGARAIGAGAAMLTPVYMAISAGSDLEETMNKFNVVFGENAAAVKKWGDTYGAEVGRSKRQIADFMGANQDLLVPMGFEAGAATKMSKEITGLAVDLASFNNKADGDVLRDLQAALTGSGEVMKKYGVIVSQAAVNQELLTMAINPKTATEAEKAQARFNIILRGTTAAQGDAKRSAGSWANQKKALAATIENVAGAIGGKLLPIVTPLLSQFKNGVNVAGEFIEQNAGLVFAFTATGAGLITIGAGALAAALAFKIAAVGVGVFAAVVSAVLSPVGLVVGAIAALVYYSGAGAAALDWLSDRFGGLGEYAQEVFGIIKAALNAGDYKLAAELLWAGIKVAWYEGTATLSVAVQDWKHLFLETWNGAIDTAARFFIDKWATLQSAWVNITRFFGDAWDITVGGIVDTWKAAQNTIAGYALEIMATIDPNIDKEAARAELSSMQTQENKDRSNKRNQSILNREKETQKELANITSTKEGATAVIDEEAAKRDKARAARLDAAKEKAKTAVADARAELKTLAAQVTITAGPDADKSALVTAAKNNTGPAGSAQARRALGSRSGDLKTAAGLQSLADLFNQAGEDKTLEEIKTGNGILAAIHGAIETNRPKKLKV